MVTSTKAFKPLHMTLQKELNIFILNYYMQLRTWSLSLIRHLSMNTSWMPCQVKSRESWYCETKFLLISLARTNFGQPYCGWIMLSINSLKAISAYCPNESINSNVLTTKFHVKNKTSNTTQQSQPHHGMNQVQYRTKMSVLTKTNHSKFVPGYSKNDSSTQQSNSNPNLGSTQVSHLQIKQATWFASNVGKLDLLGIAWSIPINLGFIL